MVQIHRRKHERGNGESQLGYNGHILCRGRSG